jgi:hypothetical protein
MMGSSTTSGSSAISPPVAQQRSNLSDEFLMHVYKVEMCKNTTRHSWVRGQARLVVILGQGCEGVQEWENCTSSVATHHSAATPQHYPSQPLASVRNLALSRTPRCGP